MLYVLKTPGLHYSLIRCVALALAWLSTAQCARGEEKPKELNPVQIRQLYWLTTAKHGVLVAARPDMARQLKLSPELTREIQSLADQALDLHWEQDRVRNRLSYYHYSIEDAPANGETPRSLQALKEQFKAELTNGDALVAGYKKQYDQLCNRVNALLTSDQREALKGFEPKQMEEKVVATIPFEKADAVLNFRTMTISHDRKILLVAGPELVLSYSYPDLKLLSTISVANDKPMKLLFDSQGETVLMYVVRAAPQTEGPVTIEVIDLTTQATKRKFVLEGKLKPNAYTIDIAPNGKQLAVLGENATICIFDSESGAKIKTLVTESNRGPAQVSRIAFSANGEMLAVVSNSNEQEIGLWKTADWSLLRRLSGPPNSNCPTYITFTPDGKELAAYWSPYQWRGGNRSAPTYDQVPNLPLVRIWNTSTGVAREDLFPSPKAYSESVRDLTFLPDGKRLVFHFAEGVSVWDVTELREIAAARLLPEQPLGFAEQFVDSVISEADGRLLVRRRLSPTSFVLSYLSLPSNP